MVVLEIDGTPEVLNASVRQAADGTLVLKAADAELKGQAIKLETKTGGIPNIGYWVNQDDYVQWPVLLTKPGTFAVEVNFACEPGSEGSECVMTIDDRDYRGTVIATGGWGDFQTRKGGQITLDTAGPKTITVKAKSKPGMAVINLRSITLKPTE